MHKLSSLSGFLLIFAHYPLCFHVQVNTGGKPSFPFFFKFLEKCPFKWESGRVRTYHKSDASSFITAFKWQDTIDSFAAKNRITTAVWRCPRSSRLEHGGDRGMFSQEHRGLVPLGRTQPGGWDHVPGALGLRNIPRKLLHPWNHQGWF